MKFIAKTFFVSVFAIYSFVASATEKFLAIATGSTTGIYFPAGGAICRMINVNRSSHGIRCVTETTSGSVYNLNAIRQGNVDIAIVQSDWQDSAFRGVGAFAAQGPDKNLTTLFSLHSEVFTLIARRDSGIDQLNDLIGKRVNIGDPGSGTRATMEVIMSSKNWSKKTFKLATEIRASDQAQALCEGKIDAMLFVSGHPNGAVQEVTNSCKAKIVPIDGKEIEELIKHNRFYSATTIPAGLYSNNTKEIKSFGIKANVIASKEMSEDLAYQITKSVFSNFDTFKTLHPVFSQLNKKQMVQDSTVTPIHPGAAKYFKEIGLL